MAEHTRAELRATTVVLALLLPLICSTRCAPR